jgi:hypothetical protein
MRWTVLYFQHQAAKWENWGTQVQQDPGRAGPAAYAARKVAMWTKMASNADSEFRKVNGSHPRDKEPPADGAAA